VAPYVPGRPVSEIQRQFGLQKVVKLASNENPLGASPLAIKAIKETADQVFMYPDPSFYDLRHALSDHLHHAPDGFIFGTGSDGLIELICKTFLSEGDESVMPDPSFSLYELNVRAVGATPVKVPLTEEYLVSPMAMIPFINEKTKVIWLCNPNNPTGGIYTKEEQRAFLEAVPSHVLVVLDEAYYEYATENEEYPDSQAFLEENENVIILRTFSKIYGLAGLRVGYGMADSRLVLQMEKVRAPFNVCLPAQAAAKASLEDIAFVRKSVEDNEKNRAFLEAEFTRMDLTYIKSYTNFIAVCVNRDAQMVYTRLLEKGYIVKGGHVLGLPGYLRVTIGTEEECKGFIKALEEVLQEV